MNPALWGTSSISLIAQRKPFNLPILPNRVPPLHMKIHRTISGNTTKHDHRKPSEHTPSKPGIPPATYFPSHSTHRIIHDFVLNNPRQCRWHGHSNIRDPHASQDTIPDVLVTDNNPAMVAAGRDAFRDEESQLQRSRWILRI
jgi:hypothetical protein